MPLCQAKKKGERTQMTNIRNEREDITAASMHTKRIMKEY